MGVKEINHKQFKLHTGTDSMSLITQSRDFNKPSRAEVTTNAKYCMCAVLSDTHPATAEFWSRTTSTIQCSYSSLKV